MLAVGSKRVKSEADLDIVGSVVNSLRPTLVSAPVRSLPKTPFVLFAVITTASNCCESGVKAKLKTSVLVGGALKLGALVGSASDAEADLIYNFGVNLGIAFQLQDDYLDCFGDPEKFGKQVGGDIISNKKTFLMLKALELDSSNLLQSWVDKIDFDVSAKVESVKTIYKDLKVDQLAFELMDAYYQKSIQFLNKINAPEDKKKVLQDFASHLMKRAS